MSKPMIFSNPADCAVRTRPMTPPVAPEGIASLPSKPRLGESAVRLYE